MNITMIAFGTRGDVQPTLALARALAGRGLNVRMVASRHVAPWIERHGIEAAPGDVDIQALMASEAGRDWADSSHSQLRQIQVMKRLCAEHGPAMARHAWEASRGADLIVSSFTSDVYAASIAERLDVPHASAPLQPALVATRSGAATPGAPLAGRDSLLNYWFGRVFIEPFGWRLMGAVNNAFRQQVLGLAPQSPAENQARRRRMLVVQGYSRHVVPHPRDWPPSIHTTGYWFLDEKPDWQPPPALAEFLDAGDPPVYVGFGSMTGRNAQSVTQTIVEALARCGKRGVLQTGWAGLGGDALPPSIFCLDAAPHWWLFPRMAAVVHHGGAGTTAEGLRAGIPTVIVPHMADQPFWGARVHALGVGPRPVPRHRLTAQGLAAAIVHATGDAATAARAASLGALIRAEDGPTVAAGLIEGLVLKARGLRTDKEAAWREGNPVTIRPVE